MKIYQGDMHDKCTQFARDAKKKCALWQIPKNAGVEYSRNWVMNNTLPAFASAVNN